MCIRDSVKVTCVVIGQGFYITDVCLSVSMCNFSFHFNLTTSTFGVTGTESNIGVISISARKICHKKYEVGL